MHIIAAYSAAVLIWGSTWIAITFQLGEVAPEISVVYRFVLASITLFALAWLRREPLGLPFRHYPMVALQGLFLFCGNYLLVYHATLYVTSGLIAVLFTSLIFVNAVNERLFFGIRIERRVIFAAVLGLLGLSLIFWPEITANELHGDSLYGIWFALGSVLIASFGNMVALRNTRHRLPIVQLNAHGMAWGSLFSAVIALGLERSFGFERTFEYIGSLIYLALFGSALAFGLYLFLIHRIGSSRAAYITVLFPIVALGLSTLFEGYRWSIASGLGVLLALGGNALALSGIGLSGPRPAHEKEVAQS